MLIMSGRRDFYFDCVIHEVMFNKQTQILYNLSPPLTYRMSLTRSTDQLY